ncbi:MAG TPA: Rrf2 family transcriptional regulator [Vicinamibacteria bacterium]|nr:Rrf2 family transcriptional regulator [Vicinamibacteria bacterium]
MKMTSQEEYGLRCLLRLGREGEGRSLTISELSRQEGISAPNVAKMMGILRRAGLVKSTRGKEGGYTLARAPEQINLGEALAILGGRFFDSRFCERHSGSVRLCTNTPDCSIRSVWRVLQDVVDGVLGRMTLKDLLRSEEEVTASVSPRAVPLPLLSSRQVG